MTASLDTVAGIHAHLDEQPGDSVARLVLADLLDELGSPLGPGYRALGRRGRVPWHFRASMDWGWTPDGRGEYVPGRGESALPGDWYDLLAPDGAHEYRSDVRSWAGSLLGRRLADDAAALAFAQLGPARRAELLSPLGDGA